MVTHTHISSHYRFVPDVWHFWMCPASLKDAAPFFSALGPKNKFLLANSVGQILTDTLSIHTMTLWFMIMGQECIFDKQRNPGQERRTILTILATSSAWLCILFKRGKESERKRVKFNRTAGRPPSIHPSSSSRCLSVGRVTFVLAPLWRHVLMKEFTPLFGQSVGDRGRGPRAVPFPLRRLFTTFDFWRRNELVLPSN